MPLRINVIERAYSVSSHTVSGEPTLARMQDGPIDLCFDIDLFEIEFIAAGLFGAI